MNRDAGAQGRLHAVAICLLALAFWVVSRAYQGIYHDARLYTLQALARLGPPDGLAQDVFLRFGSQDSYTVFSPIYALAIEAWGVETAARVLMLIGQLAWVGGAICLARAALDGYSRWVGLALLAGLPAYYGAGDIFRFAEPFLTPRIFAEALVLLGLAQGLRRQLIAATACMAVALLVHPLMAAGGVLCLVHIVARPRHRWFVPAGVIAGLAAAISVSIVAPVGPLSLFSPEWLELIRTRGDFLMISGWDAEAWKRLVATLVALYIAATVPGNVRAAQLAEAGLTVTLLGLLVTWVGSSLVHVVLLTQGQAWRWSWIATVIAMLVSATQAAMAWRSGRLAQCALLLFLCGLVLTGWVAILFVALAALTWSVRNRAMPTAVARGTLMAVGAVTASCVIGWATIQLADWTDFAADTSSTWASERLRRDLGDGVIPILLVGMFARASAAKRFGGVMVLAAGIALASMALPASIDWRRRLVPTELSAAGSSWRKAIPRNAEVLWPQNPVGSWFVLGRRQYVSQVQSAGILFSEDTSRELTRRAILARAITPPGMVFIGPGWFRAVDAGSARAVCQPGGPDYLVSGRPLPFRQAAKPAYLPVRATLYDWEVQWLYACRDIRQSPPDGAS